MRFSGASADALDRQGRTPRDLAAAEGPEGEWTARYLSGDDCVPNTGYSGFQIDVTRVFRKHGEPEVDHTEELHTTYTPSDTVVCS